MSETKHDNGRTPNWFFYSVAFILAATGTAKVWAAFGVVKVLIVADPILRIPFRYVLLIVGAVELAIALACLFTKAGSLAALLVAWLATNFTIYRVSLWAIGWHRPCPCLGILTDALHISPQLADSIMKGILAYLLIGSYGILIQGLKLKRGRSASISQ